MLKLYHLRHLCYELYLPSDLSHFQNLQSLIIGGVIHLPPSIWKLRQLRHLIFRGCFPAPDAASADLENLKTLERVHYDETIEAYLLQKVPNLVKLGLVMRPLFPYGEERHLNESLVCLRQLEKLKISFTPGFRSPPLFSAVFPDSLKKLNLERCRASVILLEAIGSLPNLQVLKLRNCIFDNATWEVREGEFPKLKMLQLSELKEITTFIVEDCSTAFPMLSCLGIKNCHYQLELSDEIGDIPTLELIEVSYCSKHVSDWARRVGENQQSYGNDTLQVRIINPYEDD